ncbi:MAG: nucleotidyltransferase domain-containing protein [Nanoarchaeota archaeon]
MLKKESVVLQYLAEQSWKMFTFTEIKKGLKLKSNSYLALVLDRFVREGIVKKEIIGHLPVYSLRFSAKGMIYGGMVLEDHAWGRRHIPYEDFNVLMDKIPAKQYIFLITGSYARGKQRAESDIDVVIIVEDTLDPRSVYAELAHYCELNVPSIHLYVFRNKEFSIMLSNKEANYGKEIIKNCLILTGGQAYLRLVKEAMEHGFNSGHLS